MDDENKGQLPAEEEDEDTGDDLENEDDTGAEDDDTESGDEDTDDDSESDDDGKNYRKIADDQKRRAEKAETELKKLKGKKPEEQDPTPNNEGQNDALMQRVVRAELMALGVKHSEDQKFILGAAKRLGVEASEALEDELVSGKLEKMREARKTRDATPAPGKRSGKGSGGTIRTLTDKFEKDGTLPDDPAQRSKIRKELVRRAQERRS